MKLYFKNIPDVYNLGSITGHMDDLQRYYPYLRVKVNDNLNTMWDALIQLIEQGIKNGELEEDD